MKPQKSYGQKCLRLDINHLVTLSPTVLLNTHTIQIYTPIGISFESRLIDLGAINSFHVDNAVFAAGKDGLSICLPRPG